MQKLQKLGQFVNAQVAELNLQKQTINKHFVNLKVEQNVKTSIGIL